MHRVIRGCIPATVLAAVSVSLGGCLGVPAAVSPIASAPAPAPKAASDARVDDVTRRILQAAGLDPSDPSRPKELGRNVAGVVQVRYQGRIYGTALARPLPGRIVFTDPNAVAAMLAPAASRSRFAAALRAPLVDVDSSGCRANSRRDRRTRKAFRIPRVCPAPSGPIWADLHRREMIVDLKMGSDYAALVQPPVSNAGALADLAQPPLTPEVVAEPGPVTVASVDLLSQQTSAPVPPPLENSPPAAAPISLTPPPAPPPAAAARAAEPASNSDSPWASLLSPAPSPPTKKVVLPMPATQVAAAAPDDVILVTPRPALQQPTEEQAVAVSSSPGPSGALPPPVLAVSSYSAASTSAIVGAGSQPHPVLLTPDPVRQTDRAYGESTSFTNVTVISGAYQPRASAGFR